MSAVINKTIVTTPSHENIVVTIPEQYDDHTESFICGIEDAVAGKLSLDLQFHHFSPKHTLAYSAGYLAGVNILLGNDPAKGESECLF